MWIWFKYKGDKNSHFTKSLNEILINISKPNKYLKILC